MSKRLLLIPVLLVCAVSALAQTSFRGIVPGTSTREQVDSILGKPVKDVSQTLIEYAADDRADKVYVQYRAGSGTVERVEVIYLDGDGRSAFVKMLGLPSAPSASQVNTRGKYEEYYLASRIVLSFAGGSEQDAVARVGYYSKDLFDSTVAKLPLNHPKPKPDAYQRAEPERLRPITISPENTRTTTANDREPLRPDDTPAEKADFDLSMFIGSYEFYSTDEDGNKIAFVEMAGGKLRWRFGNLKGTLISTGTGFTTDEKGRKVKDLRNFKLAEDPTIRVQFEISNGVADFVTFYESSLTRSSARLGRRK